MRSSQEQLLAFHLMTGQQAQCNHGWGPRECLHLPLNGQATCKLFVHHPFLPEGVNWAAELGAGEWAWNGKVQTQLAPAPRPGPQHS